MIELQNDHLRVTFDGIEAPAALTIDFQRTLRIPDDGQDHPLPPGLGSFPLRHVDDFASKVPAPWREHGGIMLPIHAAEALWLSFDSEVLPDRGVAYPFALKVGTGKRSAVTGEAWRPGLPREPRQDYLVIPEQPWLDGYCVRPGVIRQFIAMTLGDGYSVEEQLTGQAEVGGLQLEIIPMKQAAFRRRFPVIEREPLGMDLLCCRSAPPPLCPSPSAAAPKADMGLAPGGRMKQTIHEDPYDLADWDLQTSSRCFVHLCDAALWRQITGSAPPTTPPTARDYSAAGLPWFHLDEGDAPAVGGSKLLDGLKSVLEMGQDQDESPLPENEPTGPVVVLDAHTGQRVGDRVREGGF